MARRLDSTADADYIAIIRSEVDRCTQVLDQLSGRASSTSPAESHVLLTGLVEDLRYRLGEPLAERST